MSLSYWLQDIARHPAVCALRRGEDVFPVWEETVGRPGLFGVLVHVDELAFEEHQIASLVFLATVIRRRNERVRRVHSGLGRRAEALGRLGWRALGSYWLAHAGPRIRGRPCTGRDLTGRRPRHYRGQRVHWPSLDVEVQAVGVSQILTDAVDVRAMVDAQDAVSLQKLAVFLQRKARVATRPPGSTSFTVKEQKRLPSLVVSSTRFSLRPWRVLPARSRLKRKQRSLSIERATV